MRFPRKLRVLLTILILFIFTLNTNLYVFSQSSDLKNQDPNYKDLIGHWAENEFRWLIEKGIISGVKANGVMLAKPDEKLTRAEAVVIILRTIFEKELLEEEIKKLKEDSFKDISNHWSRDYINVAARYGLVKGYSDKTFRPNQRITREEFVLMVIRVSKYREQAASEGKQNDKKVKFKDVSVNNFGYNEIIFAVEKGLIKGYSDGTFRPRSYISRAEAAVIVARALKADLFITYRAKKPQITKENASEFFELVVDKEEVGIIEKAKLTLKSKVKGVKFTAEWKASGGKLEVAKDNQSAIWSPTDAEEGKNYIVTVEVTILTDNGEKIKIQKVARIRVNEGVQLTKNENIEEPVNKIDPLFTQRESNNLVQENSSYSPLEEKLAAPILKIAKKGEYVELTWNEVKGARSYIVKRGKVSGEYEVLASGVITTAYIDGPMDGKTTYYYVVAAVGANGTTSMNSNEVVYKALPQSPKLFGTYNGTSARLTWTKANGAERYTLYRSTVSGGPYYAIAENLLTNVFEDTNLTSGTVYYYVVKAINELGESEYSNEVAMGEGVTVAAKFNPDDDKDGDGLTNVDELKYATSLKKNDSDGDGLSDGYEVKKGTNPLVPDTDNDGIYDGAEVVMGTDPLTKNPLTSAEKYAVSEDGKVFVRALSDANILIAPLQVKRSDNVFINSLKGIVGKAIEITAGGFDIKKAEIVVNYDEAELNGVEENNLMLYYVNYDKKILEPLEDVVVDTVYNRVSGKTEHFSTFLLGDKNMPVDLSKVDIVFVLDNSGSMSSNDPNYYRIEATKKFIQNIDELNNRVGLVDFDSSVSVRSNLTSDKSKLLQALNAMRWTGGSTNIGGGLKAALGLFDQEQSKKIIVLLSDGYHNTGIHPNDVLPELIKQEIVVNTIALGKDCDRELLHDIADKTKGGYFYIDNTGGLSQEDVDKQIELIYEKLTKWITLQKEAEKNLKPQEVLSIEYNDVGLDNEEFHKWITTAMTNLLTGNYMEEFDDISIEGNGPEFKFVRYYNSFANQQKTIIGKGFRTNFDSKLTKVAGVGIVQAGVLNVREGPNVNTKKIGYLTKGTKVQIEEDGNKNGSGWHRIVYKGKSAYICAAYVKELNNGIEVTYPSGSMIEFVDDNGDGIYLSDSNKADKVVLSGNEYILIQRDLTRYVFDKSGKLIKISDRNENYITIEYSGEKISAARDVFGRKLEFIFQGDNLVCIRENIKGKIGRKVEFVYDDKDRLIKVIGVDGAETRYEYDEKDRLKRIIDANGHQVVRNEYDILGRIVRQYDGEDIIRFFIYDDEDRVRYYIDENGNESMVVFNEELKPIKERNALGGGCDYKYEIYDGSKWIDVTTPDLDKDVVVSGLTREKYQELKEKGSMTKQVTIQIIKTSPSLETAKTTQIYDGRGNIIQVIDAYGNSIKMKYDNNNNLIEQTDRIGATTKYIYDAEGINLIEKIDPLGNKERYEYYSINSGIKLNGLLAKYIDKNGNETRYYYEDEYNNLTRVVDAEGYETKYEYDQLGRKIKEINERGYVTRFEYDPEGRITKEIDAFGKTKVYVYDKDKR